MNNDRISTTHQRRHRCWLTFSCGINTPIWLPAPFRSANGCKRSSRQRRSPPLVPAPSKLRDAAVFIAGKGERKTVAQHIQPTALFTRGTEAQVVCTLGTVLARRFLHPGLGRTENVATPLPSFAVTNGACIGYDVASSSSVRARGVPVSTSFAPVPALNEAVPGPRTNEFHRTCSPGDEAGDQTVHGRCARGRGPSTGALSEGNPVASRLSVRSCVPPHVPSRMGR